MLNLVESCKVGRRVIAQLEALRFWDRAKGLTMGDKSVKNWS